MDFLVNNTHKSIRCVSGIPLENVNAFLNENKWSPDDDYHMFCLNTDEDEVFDYIVELIEDFDYDIPADQRPKFIFDQELISAAYDAETARLETYYNPRAEIMWDESDFSMD